MSDQMAERIKELRAKRNLTLEDVAKRVGVGKSTVRKWETGMIANMRRDKIASLADALGTTPEYLMGWTEPKEEAQLSETKAALIEIIKDISDEQAAAILALLKRQ